MTQGRDADVVVVGSGPCGAVAAARLSALGASVLVVDAGTGPVGGVVVKARGQTLFRHRAGGDLRTDRHAALGDPLTQFTSSLSLGGLSNYWTSSVPRFAPDDFTEGSAIDDRFVWPITYADLAPHYAIVERLMGVTAGAPINGLQPPEAAFSASVPRRWREVAARCQEAGFGMGPMPMAKGSPWMIALRGSEFDSYHGILRAPERAGTLRIVRNARIDTLLWSSNEGRVIAATYRTASGEVGEVRARAFVLAAGTIDTTRILLASTSPDHPTGLGNSNDLLGRYLHDHLGEWWTFEASHGLPALSHPIYLARPSDAAPMTGFGSTIGLARSFDRLRALGGMSRTMFGVQVFGTMLPKAEHRVTLDVDDPLYGPIGIALDYDQPSRDAVARARPHLASAMRAAGIEVTCSGKMHELMPGASVHYAGSVRMHASREWGVLDGWNRMYDAENVVVCDASSFTTSPEKNPTPTAMALADRAATHLAQELASDRL